jgi:hypothetical protein
VPAWVSSRYLRRSNQSRLPYQSSAPGSASVTSSVASRRSSLRAWTGAVLGQLRVMAALPVLSAHR